MQIIQKEAWKPVPTCSGLLASNFGRLMVVPFFSPLPNGGYRTYGGVPLYGTWNKTDERYQYLHKGRIFKVARLVCEAFHGAPTIEKNVCMHLDENSRNNRADNLRWGTQKENLNFPGFIKYCQSRTGENSPSIKGKRLQASLKFPIDAEVSGIRQ
jgi:hypothetical protein